MTATFRVTRAMHARVRRSLARQTTWHKILNVWFVLFPFLLIGVVVAGGKSFDVAVREQAIVIVGALLLWFVFLPLLSRWGDARRFRNYPALQGEIVYAFGDDGLDFKTAVAAGKISWSA